MVAGLMVTLCCGRAGERRSLVAAVLACTTQIPAPAGTERAAD